MFDVKLVLDHKTPIMTQRCVRHYLKSLRDAVTALDYLRSDFTKTLRSNKKEVNQNG